MRSDCEVVVMRKALLLLLLCAGPVHATIVASGTQALTLNSTSTVKTLTYGKCSSTTGTSCPASTCPSGEWCMQYGACRACVDMSTMDVADTIQAQVLVKLLSGDSSTVVKTATWKGKTSPPIKCTPWVPMGYEFKLTLTQTMARCNRTTTAACDADNDCPVVPTPTPAETCTNTRTIPWYIDCAAGPLLVP